MDSPKIAYLSLGSNQGNKFKNLEKAVNSIHNQIGTIKRISKVYSSKALGFNGANFYNACLSVSTTLTANQLLKNVLKIETELGRTRTKDNGYEDRIIDIDILLYEDLIKNAKSLILPHSELHKRRFVLQPLKDIAPKLIHPVLNKNISVLLTECMDDSLIESQHIWLKNPMKQYETSKYNYLAIEGNIGAGKTSLATKMGQDFNAKLVLERFADNAFLPKFYKQPDRYAFTLEMSFLADRYQQISDDLAQFDLFKEFIVSDYDVYKSLIFSKINLAEDEFKLYRKLFYQMYKDIAKPNLYIYLHQSIERLQTNIKKRGRTYEKHIDENYLEKINTGYLDFLKNQPNLNVKIIDISDKDFIKNRIDYLWVLNAIYNTKE